ncbi:hypothetical protein AAC387_Pa06g0033 [Persea americana]
MDSSSNHQQLMDSLTAHIALYHSSIPSSSSPSPSNPSRNLILRWFSSLSVPHRQSSLTVVDPDFLQILLQMQRHLLRQGHGFFILLPDLPSPARPSLPSLCFRRSRGLLSRSAASNASLLAISSSIRIFASKEGEPMPAACFPSLDSLDSITVSDDLVADVDRFVSIMDEVSGGGFLRADDGGLDSSWCELPWLKAKGYYSVQAFVANRIELALRVAWLNCNGGKKRGAKSKDKEKAAGVIAGVAANVFWRKKGCLDWWSGLDPGTRRDMLSRVLGRAAKSLANEIVEGANQAAKDEKWFFDIGAEPQLRYGSTSSRQRNMQALSGIDADVSLGIIPASISGKPSSLANACNRLLVLQEISTIMLACQHNEYEKEKLFFSMLGSVHTVSDCLFRRLRGLLMVVSNDCIKLELLGDNALEAPPKKSKEKSGGGCHKGKNKGRNLNRSNSGHKSSRPWQNPQKEHGSGLAGSGGAGSRPGCLVENGKPLMVEPCVQEKDVLKETPAMNIDMERAKGPVDCKTQIARKKSRKKLNNIRNPNLKGPIATGNSEANITETTLSSFTIQSEPSKFKGIVDPSIAHHLSNVVSDHSKSPPNPSICNAINEPNIEDGIDTCENIQKHSVNGAAVSNCRSGMEHFQISNRLENGDSVNCDLLNPGKDDEIQLKEDPPGRGPVNDSISSGDTLDCAFDSEIPPVLILVKDHNVVHRNSLYLNDSVSQPVEALELNETVLKDENAQPLKKKSEEYHAHCNSSLLGGISYEWPNLTSVYFPSANSRHIPAATDRLHLDVGHNWRSHLHQSYVSTRHQVRNASVEGGCSRIMPSQILPLSLDWPPMVRGGSRLVPSVSCNYDSGFIPRLHSSFCSGFTANGMQLNGSKDEDDRKYNGDFLDFSDIKIPPDLIDDSESHWMAEDESEVHAYSGRDYNQYFGGGVMYWNTADPSGTGFSRPPSLSSEDSSWAWHEADLNRAIDDMVGLPGLPASYNTNGLTSPPAGPFCSPFDQLGPGHQHLGYVMPGNDASGKVVHPSSIGTDVVAEENVSGSLTNSPGGVVETMSGDSLSYPILRPIIVSNISRKGSGTEFKISHDHKSPGVPPTRRETPRIKRPPSPVVLCVPRAPRPPPPSPVGEPRKQRGFPTVRSGSSSPRHWGVRSWYHDGTSSEEARFCVDGAEVVWPSWGNKGLPATPMIKPLPGSLLQDRLIAISQLPLDQEHPDVALPLQPPDLLNCAARNMSLTMMHNLLHNEIDCFCKQVAAGNLIKKPYINWAVKRVARSLQVLWPRSRTNVFGSNATGLALPTSDVDLVVCLPPVRNLEPIKEAGILEGRNGIKETCLQHAARYLANQEWVKSDSLKPIENTAIPVIMLVVEVPHDVISSGGSTSISHTSKIESTRVTVEQGSITYSNMTGLGDASWPLCSKIKNDDGIDTKSVRLDISFKSPSHTGLQTTKLVRELTEQFPAAIPLALVLKQFLADRNLDHSYSGGLSSYCLVLLITRFLQHEHHIGRPINQNLGSLLMDFLYFFGNVFDPRQMRISIQGSGVYVNRERGHSIDPIHIDDPLYPTNNVGRNCFRIHQCIKAFADAYSVLESELKCLPDSGDPSLKPSLLLPKIIPSIDHTHEISLSREPV